MTERKPGFIYIYSEILKQEAAWSEKTGVLYCQDGVKYSPVELKILEESGEKFPLSVHTVKKFFKDSEVMKYEHSKGADDKGKCYEKPNTENSVDVSNSGGSIPEAPKSGAGGKNGCFDIY